MILSTLSLSSRYAPLHPLFPRAFEFIHNTDMLTLAPGIHPIVGDDLFAIVESLAGRSRADAQLESHRRYIDIQLVLEGTDEMGWKALVDCHNPVSDYSAARRCAVHLGAPRPLELQSEVCDFAPRLRECAPMTRQTIVIARLFALCV